MKITQYRSNREKQTQRIMSLETALSAMRTETKSRPVSTMRELLTYARPNTTYEYVRKIPQMAFGGTFQKAGSEQVMICYNGLILLEVDKLTNLAEAVQLRDKIAALPQTLIAFVGSSGKSVKILVPFTLVDGSLPQTPDQINIFHAHAYRKAVNWYQPQIGRKIRLSKSTPDMAVRMTFDPTLYYNPKATPICMEQPLQMPEEVTFSEAQQAIDDPLQRLLPGYERHYIIDNLFETSMWDAVSQLKDIRTEESLHPFFIRLAENCFHSGIPEEDSIRFTLSKERFRNHELLIRNTFRNTYTIEKKFGNKPCITPSMSLAVRLEEFMKRRYQLRRNSIKGIVEYRELKTFCFDFRPMTKQVMNGMTWNALAEGINAWDADIRRYLESDRIHIHNPIEEYLSELPHWDGEDRIRELARRITCKNPHWADLFYIWFLSMVAHWQQKDRSHSNSTLPLLVGKQGCGKSTFCMHILPPELRDYYTDSIDFSKRKDVELALGRFALINMDEFDSISPSYQGFMKHILQKTIVQTRRPHATITESIRRYATFIATSNNFDLLTDPTGSRRFICIEVEDVINYKQPIEYKQLYAQAVHALRMNERYWFTHEEETYITASNRRFQYTTPEMESVQIYFRTPTGNENYEELTCAEMLLRIQRKDPKFQYTRTTAWKLGRVLATRFSSRRANRGNVYKVVETNRME